MILNLCCLLNILLVTHLVLPIQINYITVPPAIKNDSNHPITLDCNYSIRPDDTEVVVKWYLNNEVVYQWIPPQKPQSLGVLKNKVDLEYKASDDPKTVYSSVKIKNPTDEMSGEYKCFVSTFADEDFSIKNMIVFEPEKYLILEKAGADESNVNFTCYASDVYPTPKLILYKDNRDDFYNKNRLQILQWNISKNPNGRFSVFVVATASLKIIPPGTIVSCELRIPGTGYVKIKSVLYYPSAPFKGQGCSVQVQSQAFLIVFCSFIVVMKLSNVM